MGILEDVLILITESLFVIVPSFSQKPDFHVRYKSPHVKVHFRYRWSRQFARKSRTGHSASRSVRKFPDILCRPCGIISRHETLRLRHA